MVRTGHEVGVAFALNVAAGLATVLGGLLVFTKHLVHVSKPHSLAVALSVSAGVMLFISLVEILNETVRLLKEGIRTSTMSAKKASGHAWLAAAGCLAAGILLIYAIDALVHLLAPEHEHTAVENLRSRSESHARQSEQRRHTPPRSSRSSSTQARNSRESLSLEVLSPASSTSSSVIYFNVDEAAKRDLKRMGLLSALAIAMHNMPEGMATFAGALQNPSVGFALAIGIGLHNIPEGIAVAAPIYFATGSRWRGVMWCTISALAEPLGGLVAWLVVGDGLNPISQGALFGLVCGVMICISVKELLPTAYRFSAGQTHLVSLGVFFGIFIMVTSLALFGYAGV